MNKFDSLDKWIKSLKNHSLLIQARKIENLNFLSFISLNELGNASFNSLENSLPVLCNSKHILYDTEIPILVFNPR
jgi:hypothetical protein